MNEERLNEELDILEEIERVKEKRYQEFQQWLNQCPLVITDYSDFTNEFQITFCLLYTSPSPRDDATSRMPSSA